MEKDPFKEYLRESEPDKAHKGYAWSTAIGLQVVDGLKLRNYFLYHSQVSPIPSKKRKQKPESPSFFVAGPELL